jgi:hypothetical protein
MGFLARAQDVDAHLYAYRNVEAFQYLMSHIQDCLLSMEVWIKFLTIP